MKDAEALKEMKQRRVKGARMLLRGEKPAEVARQLGGSRQSVMRWQRSLAAGGLEQVCRVGRRGGQFRLSPEQLKQLAGLLKQGALSVGYETEIWTLPRIAALIEDRFGERLAISSVWYMLRRMGFSPQRPSKLARERNEPMIKNWKQRRWPGTSFVRFYFRFFAGSIKAPQIVEFLRALKTTIGRRLLIIWEGLRVHRSRLVNQYVESLRGTIALEFLPPYAPELNPVEYIWAYLKSHAMPNFCAKDLGHLKHHAGSRLRSMQRRRTRVAAFWQQAKLF